MSDNNLLDDIYLIISDTQFNQSCLTGPHTKGPLLLVPSGTIHNQEWEVKKGSGDEYLITLKGDSGMGASYTQGIDKMDLVSLTDNPRPFKIEPVEDQSESYRIIPVDVGDDQLVMGMSLVRVFPPMVGLVPAQIVGSNWRFEKV